MWHLLYVMQHWAGFLESGDVNVITVDWSGDGSRNWIYSISRSRVPEVAATVAEFLDNLNQRYGVKLEDVHVLGHSLGAHIAGIAGYKVTTGKIGRITGNMIISRGHAIGVCIEVRIHIYQIICNERFVWKFVGGVKFNEFSDGIIFFWDWSDFQTTENGKNYGWNSGLLYTKSNLLNYTLTITVLKHLIGEQSNLLGGRHWN